MVTHVLLLWVEESTWTGATWG